MESNNQQMKSSIFPYKYQDIKGADQLKLPTWSLVGVLIAAFILLKLLIYIKDGKRHGK